MDTLVVLCAVIAICVFGYVLMARLDTFLNSNQQKIAAEQPALRIAFENPAMMSSADALLKSFSSEYPFCEISFYFGARQDILGRLKGHSIDFGFLEPLGEKNQEEQNVHILQLHCKSEPAVLTDADRTLLPLSGESGDLVVVWLDATVRDPLCRNFEKQLMRICG